MRIGPFEVNWRNGASGMSKGKRRRATRSQARRRSFAAAKARDIYAGFLGTSASINDDLRHGLRTLRFRSREICQDNDYASRFLNMVAANVVGNNGIRLQNQAVGPDGTPDAENRTKIETAWKAWGSRGVCDVTGRMSWVDAQNLIVKTLARDGEVLIVDHVGYGNGFGYAIQVLECDRLDENMNTELQNGNRIVMGVEEDPFGKPVAYHLLADHPGDRIRSFHGRWYERIPAERVNHLFILVRPEQSRGYPWLTTAMLRLNMLGGYEEAEWTAARISSCKMGVITTPDGDSFDGDDEDADGNLVMDTEPGEWRQLAKGQQFDTFDPKHPNSSYGDFVKGVIRGAASGLNVTYTALANDLEGVNFSSIRAGVLDERDSWRALQSFVTDALCDRVYRVWLGHAFLGNLDIPPRKLPLVAPARWVPRGWAWVDPLKDVEAAERAVALGIGTRTDAAAALGRDFNDVVAQLAKENEILEEAGLPNTIEITSAGPPPVEEQ